MRITGDGIWGPPRTAPPPGNAAPRRRAGGQLYRHRRLLWPRRERELIAEALAPYPPGLVIATKAAGCASVRASGFMMPARYTARGRGGQPEEAFACSTSISISFNMPITPSRLKRRSKRWRNCASRARSAHKGSPTSPRNISSAPARSCPLSRAEPLQLCRPGVGLRRRLLRAQRNRFHSWAPLGIRRNERCGREPDCQCAPGSPRQVAIAWALQRSPKILPIPGTSSPAHVEENIAAAGLRLSDQEFKEC